MKSYRGLSITTLVLFALSSMEQGFLGPISYISKLPVDVIWQWVFSTCCLSLTLLLNRLLCQEFIHGYLERRLNTKIPALIDSLVEGIVILISVCMVMPLIFGLDISALLATLAGSAALLGFALKDFAVAFFTGIVLNVEKSFRVGDSVRIGTQAGTVEQITWRNTVLLTPELVSISIPNASIFNQTILNLDLPDRSSQRMVEVVIDYSVSVESVERILYAGALGAQGFKHVAPPRILARKLTQNGVQYEVYFHISNHRDGLLSEHAVLKNILESMRKADITDGRGKSKISNRSADVLHLVQQVRIFNTMSSELCTHLSGLLLERHYASGETIVTAGEPRHTLFIVAEGMVKRIQIDNQDKLIDSHLISTEFFGEHALFSCLPHTETMVAEADVLVYELNQQTLQSLIKSHPGVVDLFANNLARMKLNALADGGTGIRSKDSGLNTLRNSYRGQIAANYDVMSASAPKSESTAAPIEVTAAVPAA